MGCGNTEMLLNWEGISFKEKGWKFDMKKR